MQGLLKSLQARNIDGVAVTYAVAGWLLVQIASIVFPTFAAPIWALRAFIVTVVAGFPAALTIAWFASPPTRNDDATATGMSQREVVLLALLGVVLLLSVGELAFLALRRPPSPAQPANAPVETSIAVLPFQNLSSDRNTGYFAAGIQDEILTRLTKIGSLKVISRTSTAHFASRPDNLPHIARLLGVANILEGSVQKVGNAVHINVQLIKASTDANLWAEDYNRNMEDIFGVEGEVAASIAQTLNAAITGKERQAITAKATANTAAYDAYLRGLALYRKNVVTAENYQKTQDYLEQAVRLDPRFATAWALLARDNAWQYFSGDDATDARRAAARSALDAALRLEPDLAEAQLAQANFQYYVEHDYEGARNRFIELLGRWPENAEILAALGALDRRLGRWNEGEAYLRQAIVLDPLAPTTRRTLATLLTVTRDFAGALHVLDDALNIWPDDVDFINDKAAVYLELGELDEADALLKGLEPPAGDIDVIDTIAVLAIYRQRYGGAIASLQQLLRADEPAAPPSFASGFINLRLGDLRRLSGDSNGARRNYLHARDELLGLTKAQPTNPDLFASLALVYCGLGRHDAAIESAERAVNLLPVAKDALIGTNFEIARARVWARVGDADRAIPALARLLKIPAYLTPANLRFDPDFDKLRSDPRFDALANWQ
ncbi:MAG TPA: tetratricopeptide repeat protein [Rhizomicrobium sp.]|nr:tetratricopeptide repeat protein [Rhizomicrobium sp.]